MPVLAQDAAQRERNEWNFTKYDAHGRVVAMGLFTSTQTATTLQSEVHADAQWESRSSGGDYTSNTFPKTGGIKHTVNYYDNYDFPDNPFPKSSYPETSDHVQGLATGSMVKIQDTDIWLYTVICYDEKGRVKYTVNEQLAADDTKVKDETRFEYDFVGRMIESKRSISTTP